MRRHILRIVGKSALSSLTDEPNVRMSGHRANIMRIFATIEVGNVDAVTKPVSNGRDKRERFRELAESRTNKAIEAIHRIGNLSNRQIYDFEEAEVRKIIRALKDAITSVEGRFDSPRGKGGGGFKL
jgi:hypothetical protein